MSQPLLSILIVNWNTSKLTVDCLKSIFADPGLEFDLSKPSTSEKIPTEIIVVDNNSTDDSVSAITKLKHKVRVIENKENAGFGKANNQAFTLSKGNYILYLNTDTIILHGAISQSLNWLSSHPEAGMCTAQLLNADKTIQASGGYFPGLANMFTWCSGMDDLPLVNKIIPAFHPHTPEFYTHDDFYKYDHRQDWITGAYMLVRRELVESVGGFDEQIFMYGEEYEMAYRIFKKYPELQTWYLVGPQIIHLGGASAVNKRDPIEREFQGVMTFFKLHKPHLLPFIKSFIALNRFLRGTIYKLVKSHA